MQPRLVVVFWVVATLCCINGSETPKTPPLHDAFVKAFLQEGFTKDQIKAVQLRFHQEGIDTESWPFTNHAEELLRSVSNPANSNAPKVVDAIKSAGGNADDAASITPIVALAAIKILENNQKIESSSLLQADQDDPVLYNIATNAASNMGKTQLMGTQISLMTGSVASNTAAVGGLSAAVATNSAAIAGLSASVATMSQVTGPTVALAGALGVPVSTVASMALAGSFVGPLLGVIAIVYAAWPEEETDPWLQIESRVAKMLDEKFDAKRRKKLGDRLRRYIKSFAQCSQAWVGTGMVNFNGVNLPRWIVDEAQLAKGTGNFDFTYTNDAHSYPAPPCIAQLEGHMSLERDEWFETVSGQMSGLFMPFANMHVQLLSMLADHPFDEVMEWDASLKTTAAEYGNYMLNHLLSAWDAQVCRTMRLRGSLGGVTGGWRYSFVVLKVVEQPNAAKQCSDKCPGNSGWCNFCGGKDNGACCKRGDGGVCAQFDVPVGWRGGTYQACVHTECVQSNTGYYGTELKTFGNDRNTDTPMDKEDCRKSCQAVTGAVAFTLNDQGHKCTCLSAEKLKRHQEPGAFSGPTVCKKTSDGSLREVEAEMEKHLNQTADTPMEEVEPCEKSPVVSNFAEVEEKHLDWLHHCYSKAGKEMTIEYNQFYERFAKFVDMLAWKAGCGANHESGWERNAKSAGLDIVSGTFDGGSFATCNWEREEQKDKNMWIFDDTRARGWTGTSKVYMDEQKIAKTKYPMPSWLRDLRQVHQCLRNSAAGQVVNPDDGRSTAIDELLQPAAMDRRVLTGPKR